MKQKHSFILALLITLLIAGNVYVFSILEKPNAKTVLVTKVIDGDLAQVIAWYDNEWGYSCRLVEMAMLVGRK